MKTQEEAATAKSAHFAGQDRLQCSKETLKRVPGSEVTPVDLWPPTLTSGRLARSFPSICTFQAGALKPEMPSVISLKPEQPPGTCRSPGVGHPAVPHPLNTRLHERALLSPEPALGHPKGLIAQLLASSLPKGVNFQFGPYWKRDSSPPPP